MLVGGEGSYDQMADGGEDSFCSRQDNRGEVAAAIITPRIVERAGGMALKYHRRRSPGQTPSSDPSSPLAHYRPPTASFQTSRAKSVRTQKRWRQLLLSLCAAEQTEVQETTDTVKGGNRAEIARGPHPRLTKTPLRRHATRREAARRLARRLPAPWRRRRSTDWPGGPGSGRSQIAAAAAPRPAPLLTDRSGPGDIFGGTSAVAAAQTLLNDDAPPNIR